MKLKVIRDETPKPVVSRFPHLEVELHQMMVANESFSQLCRDYKDVVGALRQADAYANDTRVDLLHLKTTLEVEILEQVSRRGVQKQI